MPRLDALIRIAKKKQHFVKSECKILDYLGQRQTNLEISTADTENAATRRLAAFLTVPCYTLHSGLPVFPGSVLRHDVTKFWSENCKQTIPWASFREREQLGEQMMFGLSCPVRGHSV